MTDIEMTAMMTDMMRHDRHDVNKPRYCDGQREERDRGYEYYGTYRKRYIASVGNQKGIKIALKVKLKNKWMNLSNVQLTF